MFIISIRYGSTTYIMPPAKVLHVDLLGSDGNKLKEAMESSDPPMVVVIPYYLPVPEAIELLTEVHDPKVTTAR